MEEGSSVLESGLLLATLSADIYLLLPESWQLGRGKLGCKEKRSPGRSTADRIFRRRFSEPIVSLRGDLPLTNVEGERSREAIIRMRSFIFRCLEILSCLQEILSKVQELWC